MARYLRSRRFRCVTLWLCIAVVAAPPSFVHAGGGLAAIDAFHVGRYHLACGDRHKALDSFNDALRMNPQFVQAYIARGKLLAELGEFDSALADLNFALRLQPTHAEGFAYRGFVLLSQDKPEEALPEFDMALRLDPSYARVHYLRGQALRATGNEAVAATSIAAALQLDPSIESLNALATTSGANGQIGTRLNVPAGLERASQMADTTVPTPPELSRSELGRVVRYDKHPQLANLSISFVPPSAAMQQPQEWMQPGNAQPGGLQPLPPHPQTGSGEVQTARQPGPNKQSSVPPKSPPKHPQQSKHDSLMLADLPLIMPPPAPDSEAKSPTGSNAPTPVQTEVLSGPKLEAGVEPGGPKITTMPKITSLPPTVVDEIPSAAEILSGNAAGNSLPPKPTPEASRERIAEAIASTQRSVTEAPPALVSDKPAVENPPAAVEQPAAAPPQSIAPLPTDTTSTPAESLPIVPLPPAVVTVSDDQPQPAPQQPAPPVAPPGDAERALVDAEACRQRGLEREENADPSAALREYDNAARIDPTNPQTYCLRGRLYLKANLTLEAAADFERAVQLAPGLAIGYYGRAHARYLQRDFANAIDDYNACLRLDDQHALALIERGHCLAQIGDEPKGEIDRLAALALDPSLAKTGPKYGGAVPKAPVPTDILMPTPSTSVYVSDVPAKIEQTAASEPAPASAFGDLFVGDAPAPQTLPVDAPIAGTTDGVATATDRADPIIVSDAAAPPPVLQPAPVQPFEAQPIQALPPESLPLESLPLVAPPTAVESAEVLPAAPLAPQSSENGAAQQELQRLSDELSRAPGDAKLYFRRALTELKLNRAEDAIDDLNAALRINPQSIEALTLRAEAHKAAQRLPAAEADLNELLKLKPNDGALLAERGGVRLALGLVKEALNDLSQALSSNHDSAEAYCHRGLAWAVLGDAQKAMNDFAAALQREPNNAEIYVSRGRAYAEFNRPNEAIADFNRAVELDPNCADAYFERSAVYAARGAYEKSQSDRRKALSLDPTLR